MLSKEKIVVLKEISKSIEAVLQKIDTENQEYLSGMNLNDKQKKLALKAMEDFEKKIQAFFIAQKKEILAAVKELPNYMAKHQWKVKRKIKKAAVPEELLDAIAEIMEGFIFANEKQQIDKMEELFKAFADSFFSEVAEICARSVTGSKLGPKMSLTDRATAWLDQHKIKFAEEVSKTTHDAIIASLKESLKEGKGNNPAGNGLVSAVPNHFNQEKLKRKSSKLAEIVDADKYNRIYQSVEHQQCFEFYRARRIARTETISAVNAATLEGWRQSEVIGGKEWVCANSTNSRKSHKAADGQQVALEEPFVVDGERLMHPGDSSLGASAKNIIQCRCTMKSVLKYKMRR